MEANFLTIRITNLKEFPTHQNALIIYESVKKHERTTKVFAKAGLDNVTSAVCKHQQQFGLDCYGKNK